MLLEDAERCEVEAARAHGADRQELFAPTAIPAAVGVVASAVSEVRGRRCVSAVSRVSGPPLSLY
jgi:hypothetical protein